MAENENKIQVGNLGNIDWNKIKPGIKKESISEELNTIWSKIDTSGDGKLSQAELDALKSDLTEAIEDKKITSEEAKAYLQNKNLNDIEDEKFLQFMIELGNANIEENEQPAKPKAADFGFVNGRIENVKIDARAAGVANRVYEGVVRIQEGATMPEDGSLPKILMMELPSDYGENKFTKLTYNEADGTYMSRFRDMAFTLEKDDQGNVILKAVDDEQLKMKRAQNLENWAKGIPTPEPDHDTDLNIDTGTDTGIESDTEVQTDTDIDTDTNIETDTEIQTDTDIDTDTEISTDTDTDNNKKIKDKPDDLGLDNYYGSSSQKGQGDCYLMASINALRNVENGQEYLQKLRTEKTVNGEKVYTLRLPGAMLAADSLKEDNLKGGVFITGEYSFTETEVAEILSKAGQRYSKDDPDVILLEAAFEKYREEVKQTLDANNLSIEKYWNIAGMVTGRERENPLEGGWEHDAIFILTGKKSELYAPINYSKKPILSTTALKNNQALPILQNGYTTNYVNELDGNIRRTDYALDKMLDKLEKDFKNDNKANLIATASFNVGSSISDNGGHAFTIKRVTSDQVILINPWYPDKELVMTRDMFMEYCTSTTIASENTPKSRWQKIKEFTGLDQFLG